MYCHKCGKEVSDKGQFCRFCGTKIYTGEKEEHVIDKIQKILFSEYISSKIERYKNDSMYRVKVKKIINRNVIPLIAIIVIAIVGFKVLSIIG